MRYNLLGLQCNLFGFPTHLQLQHHPYFYVWLYLTLSLAVLLRLCRVIELNSKTPTSTLDCGTLLRTPIRKKFPPESKLPTSGMPTACSNHSKLSWFRTVPVLFPFPLSSSSLWHWSHHGKVIMFNPLSWPFTPWYVLSFLLSKKIVLL